MASVKLEDCSQTLELNVNIKVEEEDEKIRTTVSHGRLRLSLRPVTSTVSTNPSCHFPSTLSRNLQSLGPDCDGGAQFALQDPEMASVKLEDCSQTLELNVNIKDEEEEEKIGKSVNHGLELSLRPVTSTVTTNPACLSPSTLSPNPQSLGPDCDSGAQFAPQNPEMASSVKLEDCSQTLELNVNIKDEEEEEKIGKSVSHARRGLATPQSLVPTVLASFSWPLCFYICIACSLGFLGWVSVKHFVTTTHVKRAS
ncbi:uncharacterized protein LOC129860181 [Salvelinus fontinalis]|uniref:uncharacterized protein LOC129860181 n=1 Tax=Salvelinus fontinalis TaxID=8038 RepID=UPI00248532EE|nr:uncharacterized protein LOC129860181 [Salvelinus fontinalis]